MSARFAVMTLGVASAVACAVATGAWFGGYRVNLTPSEQLGLWRIEPLVRKPAIGDVVFICLPATDTFLAAFERGYLRRGLCPSGLAPLIKTVAALPGNHIEVSAVVSIDGRPLRHSAVRTVDGVGRPLSPVVGGKVPPGHLFLHSDFEGSYDSRYFGPVPENGVLGLARPVLTFYP